MTATAERRESAITTGPNGLLRRKFVNPTPNWVGANVFSPKNDGSTTAVPVEPGGAVWLSPEEERMTAEAPRQAEDNPFVKVWEEPVEFDQYGNVLRTETRHGMLVLSDDEARPIASDRYTPAADELRRRLEEDVAAERRARGETLAEPSEEEVTADVDEDGEQTAGPGQDPHHRQEPTPATRDPHEITGAPDAAARERGPVPVTDRPRGADAIGLPPRS